MIHCRYIHLECVYMYIHVHNLGSSVHLCINKGEIHV